VRREYIGRQRHSRVARNVWWGGPCGCFSFEKRNILTVDEFGMASIIGSDRTIKDMIVTECGKKTGVSGAPKCTI
jgi:hypothetical protein